MEEIGLDGDNNPATRLVYNHHGIRVFYKQTGRLGKFDFQTMVG
eukprot:SAG22_NODE_663_length_8042_cov_12.157371_4_plen_44_part_00